MTWEGRVEARVLAAQVRRTAQNCQQHLAKPPRPTPQKCTFKGGWHGKHSTKRHAQFFVVGMCTWTCKCVEKPRVRLASMKRTVSEWKQYWTTDHNAQSKHNASASSAQGERLLHSAIRLVRRHRDSWHANVQTQGSGRHGELMGAGVCDLMTIRSSESALTEIRRQRQTGRTHHAPLQKALQSNNIVRDYGLLWRLQGGGGWCA